MPPIRDVQIRLNRLESLLTRQAVAQETDARRPGASADQPAIDGISAVGVERLRALTAEVRERMNSSDLDDLDGITMRLLLDEYRRVFGRVRAAVRATEHSLRQSHATVHESQRYIDRELRHLEQKLRDLEAGD